jgi:hypothetical protein
MHARSQQGPPLVSLVVEFRIRPGRWSSADGSGPGSGGDGGHAVTVEWSVPGSGRPRDRWLVSVVLEPVGGGPALCHRQSLVSDGLRSRHTVEVEVGEAGPAIGTSRAIATVRRRARLGAPAAAAFAELGIVRFHHSA